MGIARREDGRGFVLVDLDQDGALDLVLHNSRRNPIVALVNRAAGTNRWIRLRLRGTTSNRFGIGARVRVDRQIREMQCGSGFLSCNPPELHYGMGSKATADVTVRWPSGRTDRYASLATNRIHTLVEGQLVVARSRKLHPLALEGRRHDIPDRVGPDVGEVLNKLETLEGKPAWIKPDRPRSVVFFSMACIGCRNELVRQRVLETRAKEIGARIVWVTIDADSRKVQKAFTLNRAPVMPFRSRVDLSAIAVPDVYLVDGERVDRFMGRHAVVAALEEAGSRSEVDNEP